MQKDGTYKEVVEEHFTVVRVMYFSFTSLSTVGFGDFHPRSNAERLIGSIVMLLGVMINSIVVESLALMIKGIRMVDDDYEEYA